MPQRHLREMEKSIRATQLVTAKLGNSYSCLWAGLAHNYYSCHGHRREIPALVWLALAALDPLALFATESEFWASLLVSGLHSCPKVIKGQTHWPHVQSNLSTPSRISLGPRECLLFKQWPFSSTQDSLCLFPRTMDIFSISKLSWILSGTWQYLFLRAGLQHKACQSLKSDPPPKRHPGTHMCAWRNTLRPEQGASLRLHPQLLYSVADTAALRPTARLENCHSEVNATTWPCHFGGDPGDRQLVRQLGFSSPEGPSLWSVFPLSICPCQEKRAPFPHPKKEKKISVFGCF